ncbi:TonB-dependent receptor domain-containing protein [uncultured Hymenobacter sp.]|uniref:TonB-dependent receptor n=1 Tax=uncultured Hymenobacter sp. TaxID=170016 RepID=UPI0035C98364
MKLLRGPWPLLFALAAPLLALPTLAQSAAPAAVRGEVTEAATPMAVPGAVVRWLAPADSPAGSLPSTITAASGSFTLARPALAADRLVISALGYRADTVLVPAGGAPYLRVRLQARQALGEVTVTARGPAYSALTPANAQMISSRDLTKSACCNLAESFETNAAVEVSTTDAVSGARQIQLLGLDGAYSLLTIDNQPALRGLAAPYRLGYLAGPWIDNIEIIKGTGSVVNGYEAISGQVNVRLKEPDLAERLLVNVYGNDLGKTDFNLNAATQLSPKWSTLLLLHSDHLGRRADRNADGFLDLPLATQLNAYNKWKYKSGTGLVSEFGFGALRETRQGGQVAFREGQAGGQSGPFYGTTGLTNRLTGFSKTSYTWPTKPFQSLGLLVNATNHDFTSAYGRRTYNGTERTGQATLLFQSVIGSTAHTYRLGTSFLADDFREFYATGVLYSTESAAERYAREHRNRRELVPGVFGEYTYQNSRNLTVVAGLRADYHNLFGLQVTPRLNVKLDAAKNTVLRAAAGRGFRVPNPIADNVAMLVSSRELDIRPGLRPEKAWNVGGSVTQYFTLLGRPATFITDYYHTEFDNQLVADMYSAPGVLYLDNLAPGGRSFARSLQAELQVELLKGLQVKGAYKLQDVRTDYAGQRLPKPLTPRNRAFLNLAYATRFDKWRADATVQWFGQRPLAHITAEDHQQHGGAYRPLSYAPRYALLNTQVTRGFKRLDVYAGVENLTNFRQRNPIEGATAPFGPAFDAAMVWGPVYGRLTYAGLRYRLE